MADIKGYKSLFFSLLLISFCRNSCQDSKSENDAKELEASCDSVDIDYRLSKDVIPVAYNVKLVPYLTDLNFTFGGEVTIEVFVQNPVATIELHSHLLNIHDNPIVTNSEEDSLRVSKTSYNNCKQTYSLHFPTALEPETYRIRLKFDGILREDPCGFYRTYYMNSGRKRWIVVTQFETVCARRAFPCFDEPSLKAKFSIWVAHLKNQTALSNMPRKSSPLLPDTSIGDRIWSIFRSTQKMSSYLVAIVVFDFNYVANYRSNITVWTSGDLESAGHVLAKSRKYLDLLSNFTGIDYSDIMPKMDQVIVPNTPINGMENWGLITYRERNVELKSRMSTSRQLQDVNMVICHELTHQWFGNLVGPAWWKYIWLNEGIATYFQYLITSSAETSWGLMDHFTINLCHKAFEFDLSTKSHPLNVDIEKPSRTFDLFDTITYYKGACTVRMLSHILGEEVFQNGVRIYLTKRKYESATTDDLWEAFQEASDSSNRTLLQKHLSIKTIMDTWTDQKGYPLITVIRNYTTNTQEITQEPFLLKSPHGTDVKNNSRWWIPINFVAKTYWYLSDTAASDWMRKEDDSIMLTGFNAKDWIIFNMQQMGYYRVNYDDTNWKLISNHLRTYMYNTIHVLNRAQLIDDSLNLAKYGYVNYSIPLELLLYLPREKESIPWEAALAGLSYLNTMLKDSHIYGRFKNYVLGIVTTLEKSLGYEVLKTDDHLRKLLRTEVLSWACMMGNNVCKKKAEQTLLKYYGAKDPNDFIISPDLKVWAYCEGIRHANKSVWYFFLDRYFVTKHPNEQDLLLSGLGCIENKQILTEFLSLLVTGGLKNRYETAISVFGYIYKRSSKNIMIVLDFLDENYKIVAPFLAADSWSKNPLCTLLTNIAETITNDKQITKLKSLISRHEKQFGAEATCVTEAITMAEKNMNWLKKYERDIVSYFQKEDSNSVDKDNGSAITLANIMLITLSITIAADI
ncbi:aminopeptidase N [Orussus abietinus]|uniref:aminopeptidase N n=1 Tax=Orussus abietinus TaxID=222816 RepID=UPI000626502D|nr:aminopeptidase N [Orussus abietinus]